MANEDETIADIIAEMRYGTIPKHRTDHELLAIYADRIDAAWKRERAKVEADALAVGGIVEAARHKPVGNAAAMREALENAYSLLCEGIATEVDDELKHPFHLELACEKIQNALAAPPRNCDVGTAEEQYWRYDAFCDTTRNGMSGYNCEDAPRCVLCFSKWAQRPYEAQKGGAK